MIGPVIRLFNLLAQLLGEEIKRALRRVFGQQIVKGIVEHADNLAALVVHNLLRRLVVQRRHGEATLVVCILLEVYVAHVRMCVV